MNYNKVEDMARLLASKAKPGFLKKDGKLYTFEFDQKEWVYNIYEDGFLLLRVNVKSLSKAKRFLTDWLLN